MAREGVSSPFDIAETSVLGFLEGVMALPRIQKRADDTAAVAKAEHPDIAVLIDSWGFTLRVAQRLRRADPSLPLIKYVGPAGLGDAAGPRQDAGQDGRPAADHPYLRRPLLRASRAGDHVRRRNGALPRFERRRSGAPAPHNRRARGPDDHAGAAGQSTVRNRASGEAVRRSLAAPRGRAPGPLLCAAGGPDRGRAGEGGRLGRARAHRRGRSAQVRRDEGGDGGARLQRNGDQRAWHGRLSVRRGLSDRSGDLLRGALDLSAALHHAHQHRRWRGGRARVHPARLHGRSARESAGRAAG